jgi:outer membrane cobalamin receptor
LYGDSAIGGVVQILTDQSTGGWRAVASGGSFGTATGDVSFGRRIGAGGFHAGIVGRTTDGAFDHSAADHLSGTFGSDGRAGRATYLWNVGADSRKREDPGPLDRATLETDARASDPIYRFDGTDRRGLSAAFTLRHESTFRPQARLRVASRRDEQVRTILLAPGFGNRQGRNLDGLAIDGSVEAERTTGTQRPVVMRFGIDLAREQLDLGYGGVSESGTRDAITSISDGRRMRAGLFFSSLYDPLPRLRLSAALRWDEVDDAGFGAASGDIPQRAWSPRAGAVVSLTDSGSASLFLQVSRAFKAPTLEQRFDPRPYPDFRGGSFTISNPRLEPQRATNVEAGLAGGGAIRWSALAYRMSVDDEIDFDVRTFSYGNIRQSAHTGVEAEVEGRAWRLFRPSASYAYSRVVADGDNRQLKNVPRHVVRLAANGELPGGLAAYVRFTRAAGAYLDDEASFPLDGAATIDLRVQRRVGPSSIYLDIVNLANDRYDEYGFTLSDFTGAAVPYVYSGASRAVRVGVSLALPR